MKLKFFLITIVVICLILSITGTTTELYQMAKPTSLIYKNNPVVILDAGHGGFDGGAVADDGTVEKDLNLQIAKKVEKFIKAFGFATVMTRNDDASTDSNEGDKIRIRKKNDMHNRLNTMKQYENAVFVSIHLNKFSQEDCHGAQVIYSPRTADSSKLLAEKIQDNIVTNLQKNNKRVVAPGNKDTFLLYNAPIPAVIVECGFLSNDIDLKNLSSEEYQSKIAFCISTAVTDFLAQ
ncbi:MAG: N-acetylmuramoyl-L-alanine amidase [bacterium]|nr:N-acetylmuramoyl-L-alanine amidase [bacterium]